MAPDRGSSTAKQGSSRLWSDLSPALSPWVLDALTSMNFSRMTPVQASTIPLFMAHKDVVVEAVTGSGKTLSFLIPIVERLLRLEEPTQRHHIAAIIISPTRELATQIHKVLLSLLSFHASSADALCTAGTMTGQENPEHNSERKPSATAFKVIPQLLLGGSTSPAQDLSKFLKTSPNLLVSTPGRLLEILSSPYVHCPQSSFEVLVLDEADRLLDLGFKDDLTKILALLPKQRRTGLFSASVSEAVDQVIRVGLRNPVRITVKVKNASGVQDKRTPASLTMTYLVTPASRKMSILSQLLHKIEPVPLRTIVYLSTCAAVDYFQSLIPVLLPPGMQLVPLHGKHPANVRQKNYLKFTTSTAPSVLLTTDVAARGLDIPEVDLVVQVDPPSDPKVFLHRCGRAGRAGRRGLSVVFLQPGREEDYIPFLEVRQTPIKRLEEPVIVTNTEQEVDDQATLRQLVLQDRALHDKAQKAFVSWVRSYSKHQASSIFRVADLDWGDLAVGWILLRMPKMPELRNWDSSRFEPPPIAWDNYAYRDKVRENQRKEVIRDQSRGRDKSHVDTKKRPLTTSWSENMQRKVNKAEKKSRKDAQREHTRQQKLTDNERQEEAETLRMIAAVKKQHSQKAAADTTFEGFD